MIQQRGACVMSLDRDKYEAYISILKEELVPALGCTEPIAIAYAAAKTREVLGNFPDSVKIRCSGNIIKNVKSVKIPNTGNLQGIKASALIGFVGGNASKGMQVLEDVTQEHIDKVRQLADSDLCTIEMIENDANLHIVIKAEHKEDYALVELIHTHTNISRIEKNGEILFKQICDMDNFNAPLSDRSILNVADILTFADTVELSEVKELVQRQKEYNLKIAEKGLKEKFGANIGKTILESFGNSVYVKMRAYAAAGSDARMNGCNYPVVTNSGSGNQGMTASLPVIIYAMEMNVDEEKMYRALVLSNLITIHLKTGIGRLSAYCGVVSAACGSGAALTYLKNGGLDKIEKTITNTLANVSGIICDGAKSSCAAKIASSIDAAIMAAMMAMKDVAFEPDTGIVKKTVEKTISAVGRIGRVGMKETDVEILNVMIEK